MRPRDEGRKRRAQGGVALADMRDRSDYGEASSRFAQTEARRQNSRLCTVDAQYAVGAYCFTCRTCTVGASENAVRLNSMRIDMPGTCSPVAAVQSQMRTHSAGGELRTVMVTSVEHSCTLCRQNMRRRIITKKIDAWCRAR